MMMGWGILNMILTILIVGFIIYGIILVVMKPFEKKQDSSLEILRERFAQGEITEQEYEEKKKILQRKD
ncbi:SHOCT domain-containing protein [Pseudalkalibacillus sp. A8]|uniref:SHOCT domain-containing protein n=1 Tax=Pseudalkalibacillus sp. A8 TaxID=3382641 RepID=UPI0038B5F3A3